MWTAIQAWWQRRADRRLLRDRLARAQLSREQHERDEARRLLDARLFRLMRSAA